MEEGVGTDGVDVGIVGKGTVGRNGEGADFTLHMGGETNVCFCVVWRISTRTVSKNSENTGNAWITTTSSYGTAGDPSSFSISVY